MRNLILNIRPLPTTYQYKIQMSHIRTQWTKITEKIDIKTQILTESMD